MEYALVVRWLVLYLALFALGLPLVARLLPESTGRGAGLAVPASLVVLSLPAYWVGHLRWGPGALAAGVLTLLAASALAGLDLDALCDRRVRLAVDLDRGATRDAVVVFALGFAFVVALRAVDPAVHPGGGEKFLDFGLLKTLARSTTLPPEDFWFANEPVRYYYGGHLTATLLAWLAATPPRFAYNLALAGFYASLVAAAFELAGSIGAERVRTADGRWTVGDRSIGPRTARRLAGAVAVFFVGFASNLVTAGRFALLALPDSLRTSAARLVAARTAYSVETILAGADSFSYWDASRVIPGTINEFPLFAWLNGDLHAHMMGTPTLLLAAAVGYAYFRTPESAIRRRRALLFGALPALAAWQAVQNTWSVPSVLALGWLAATFAPARPTTLLPLVSPANDDGGNDDRGHGSGDGGNRNGPSTTPITTAATRELRRVGSATAVAGIAAVPAVVLAAPFLLGTATGGGKRAIELLGPEMRSGFGGLFFVHGAFLAGFAGYLLSRLPVSRPWTLAGGVAVAVYVGYAIDVAALGVSVPLLAVAWIGLRASRSVRSPSARETASESAVSSLPLGYETVLIIAGAGLVTLVELVYVNEQAGPGRMNTVFKTYAQVWVFWGTAMGVAIPGLAVGGRPGGDHTAGVSWRRGARVGLALLVIASTSLYGVLAVGAHFQQRPAGGATLDATQFVETRHPKQATAIEWIDDLEGQPTLLEAPGTTYYPGGTDERPRAMYSWYANPASSLTGVPTVAGWRHEVGYRGREAYRERVRDVDAIYTGNVSARARLLEKYEVRYIWVGPNERLRYGSIAFSMDAIEVVHRSGNVVIYAVALDELPNSGTERETTTQRY
ncbi:MAG: DUF2298 domain-containing protein [Haloquadratum sp.]